MTKRNKNSTPFREAVELLCGARPPSYVRFRWPDGPQAELFQEWVLKNIPDWMTGYGVIEAAEHIVYTAIENGNLHEFQWPPGIVKEQIASFDELTDQGNK